MSPRPQLSPFFPQSPFSLHFSGGVGRALFDCQCWIRGIERGWQRAGGTCFGFVALLKWPLWRSSHHRGFAACRGVLTLQLEAHEVSGGHPCGQPRRSCRRNMSPRPQFSPFLADTALLQAVHTTPASAQSVSSGSRAAPAGGTCPPASVQSVFLESVLAPFCRWSGAGSFFLPIRFLASFVD